MPKIENVEVFGLGSSIYRSGYPMLKTAPTKLDFGAEIQQIETDIMYGNVAGSKHIQRAIKLANAKGGGHDQFMTGIVVNFDLTLSNKAWVEAERYTFLNFISSMSTMHRISAFPIEECCNEYVSKSSVARAEELQSVYNYIDGKADPEEKRAAYLSLLYNLPAGFEVMAAMTTNYRALKNIYSQRRTHRLPDWQVVCDWIETLPLAKELIVGVDV
jgi:hypothetical protein